MKNKPSLTYLLEKNKHLFESDIPMTKQDKKAFLESVKSFSNYRESIFRPQNLREVSKEIGDLIERVENFTLKESDWMDGVTVSRHMKRLKESYNVFEKTCNELSTLQQRLEAAYDDIGTQLKQYYDV